jgi:hypothetical protein
MRYFILFWLLPVGFLVTWFGLSHYDMSGGIFFFSREMHDMVFQIYGEVLGIDPATIPPLVLRALILDTFLILGLIAFRRRKQIRAWWANRQEQAQLRRRITTIATAAGPVAGQVHPAE